jgi:hypothetical protein
MAARRFVVCVCSLRTLGFAVRSHDAGLGVQHIAAVPTAELATVLLFTSFDGQTVPAPQDKNVMR